MPLDLTGIPNGTPLNNLLLKRVLWDSVPDDEVAAVMKALDLPLDSQDVADLEQADAQARLRKVGPLTAWGIPLAHMAADVNSEYFRLKGLDFNEPIVRQAYARNIIIGVLAELLDVGHIAYGQAR